MRIPFVSQCGGHVVNWWNSLPYGLKLSCAVLSGILQGVLVLFCFGWVLAVVIGAIR
jgi:hypothetical protein